MTRPDLVLLDRDGTLLVEKHYLHEQEQVELIPGAGEAAARLNRAGIIVVVVTNQSGVGRGLYPEEDVHHVHRRMEELLAEHNAHLDAIYHCPNQPEDHADCRKPNPGMLNRASLEFDIPLENAVMIGDKMADLEAGRRTGAATILVKTGYGATVAQTNPPEADRIVDDLPRAVELLLA